MGKQINIVRSDENSDILVLRIRFINIEDETDFTVAQFIREIAENMCNNLVIKGFREIKKVYAKKYNDFEVNQTNGKYERTENNWMVETDGVALGKILVCSIVDSTKTYSNDVIEICSVLGIEAARQSLINELRVVLDVYGIYINFRHICLLCDAMTINGKLQPITRHGLGKGDATALKRCSFE